MKINVQKHWYSIGLSFLILVAIFTRLHQLGQVPHGMTWDEAAIGYNGYAMWTLHRDEWVHFMPISFQSFGDWKAPLAIYLNGFFTLVFGMSLFSVRLPFALAGIALVAGIAWVGKLLAELAKYEKPKLFSLLLAAGIVFSPWHIHFSRVGFESGLALSLLIWGVGWLLSFCKNSRQNTLSTFSWQQLGKILVATAFFSASMYTYHSAKIVAPVIGLALLWFAHVNFKSNIKYFITTFIFAFICLAPMVYDSLLGPGASRLAQVSVFNSEQSPGRIITTLASNFLQHFNPWFLVSGYTTTLRHGPGAWGVLLPTTFIFWLYGFVLSVFFLAKKSAGNKASSQLLTIGFVWMVVGLLPAVLGGDGIPHSNRALLAIPGFLILASAGLIHFLDWVAHTKINKIVHGNHGEKNTILYAVIGTILLLHTIFFSSFWKYYFTGFAVNSADAFQDGYLEMAKIVTDYQKGLHGKPEVSKIMMSSEYGQPYIYFLFSQKLDPRVYQGGGLQKFEFTSVDIGDFQRTNTLVVATKGNIDFPLDKADHTIYGSDGTGRFYLYYLP